MTPLMEFNSNKPIFLQICDSIYEKILSGELPEGSRILSVRELGADIGVNPNTVMRSYERLTFDNIIYNRRGIGYFISEGARAVVLEKMRAEFIENELPLILKKMQLLGISPEMLSTAASGTGKD